MRAILAKTIGDLRHHRVQAIVIALIVILASGTGVIALSLETQSGNPYDQAFNDQRGPHLMAWFDSRKVAAADLAATVRAIGASDSAGPFLASGITLANGDQRVGLNLSGRDSPLAAVDRIRVVAGRWVAANGELVITKSLADLEKFTVGMRLKDTDVPSTPTLTVVGEVVDIAEGPADLSSQTAFVTSATLPSLVPSGQVGLQMLYRFAAPPTQDQLARAVTTIRASLPAGALADTVNFLLIKSVYNITGDLVVTMLLAFSVFALVAAALVVANMVTGTVLANYREIGVMKAIGFTPGQVVVAFVVQMLVPAAAGCVVGIPVGMVLSQPLVASTANAVGIPAQAQYSPALAVLTLVGALVIVAVASLIPALRAGRLSSVEAMTRGAAPARARSSRLAAALNRLHLPRPVILGSRDAFARPLRGAFTTVAVVVGVASAIFAVGLHSSLDAWARSLTGSAPVSVTRTPGFSDPQMLSALASQPGTDAVVAVAGLRVSVHGIADPVQTLLYRGDSRRLGLGVVSGRWFDAPGEALAPKQTFDEARIHIGDTVTVDYKGTPVRLTMVGEVLAVSDFGREFAVDWRTFASIDPSLQPYRYQVLLKPGVDPATYARQVRAVAPDFIDSNVQDLTAGIVGILDAVGTALAVILILIAVAGCFNTLLLTVRERRRDLATLKAVGMTPPQLIVMVATTGAVIGLVGGVIGLPAGLLLHRTLLTLFAAQAGNDLPASVLDVFAVWSLPLFVLAGVVVAVLGSLGPARGAARTGVAAVLHSE